ncbi:degenerin unc-8, partial [Aphelenchoides avenae]
MPTVTDKGPVEQKSTTQSGGNDPNSREPTTRSYDRSENHVTTESDGIVPDGNSTDGSSSTTATTGPAQGSIEHTTKKSNEEGDGSEADFTTRSPDASGNELTTTSYGDYLKSIKLDLSSDFDLEDLNEEQTRNLEDLSRAYGLDPSTSQVVVDGNMKQALQTIAAKMTPEQRQALGFKLKDLVSSCIMDGERCDMANDFVSTFDVDYGNCYTFNCDTPAKYVTKRAGSSRGLRMVIMSNTTESLPSTSEQGVKIVVHSQDVAAFPNVEGLMGSVGQMVSLKLTQSKLSKLGAPHGNCSTLESVAKNKQPFYYNGSYSTEGCLRSCFQRNLATACGCADSRFPPPTDMNVPFCDPLDPPKYKCKEEYVQDIGDYFFVDNCQCYDACEDTAYTAQVSESNWPAGGFFYGPYCPRAEKLNLSCREFYSNNGMTLEVSFATLGYEMKEEEPTTTAWGLANNLAGNSGLWIGYTMLSFVECILISIQICLWVCRCPKELPEVPSCRRRNFWADVDEDSGSESSSDDDGSAAQSKSGSHGARGDGNKSYPAFEKACRKRSAVSRWRVAPKNFDNCFGEK